MPRLSEEYFALVETCGILFRLWLPQSPALCVADARDGDARSWPPLGVAFLSVILFLS
jgi:hypothetical protein